MRKLGLAVLLLISLSGSAQSWDDTLQKIERIFSTYKNQPGAQLAISRNGQVIFSKAWGLADLEHDVPLSTISVTEAGSVSKQFTAACILLLQQQGKLSLEDDVRKYIPELPDYSTTVKLRHMMQHTSGLRDWGSIGAMAGWTRSTKTYDNDDALQIMTKQKALNNVPGAEYIYSNSNYNLFAVIIQRVSGMSLADFSRKYIFEPAGMKLTQWRDNYRRVVKNRAIAYDSLTSGYQTSMPNEYVYGNGGLLTTAEELLKWNEFYLSGKLGQSSLLAKQLTLTPLNNGNKNSYAAGLFITTFNGWKDITHDGATAGYRADLHHISDLGLSIAWLSNNSKTTGPAYEILNLFVPKKSTTQTPPVKSYPVPTSLLKTYAGWYRNRGNGFALQMIQKDSALVVQNQKLTATAEDRFVIGANTFIFSGKVLQHISANNDTTWLDAAPAADPSALQTYTGTYASEETDSRLTVTVKDSQILVRMRPSVEFVLTPTYKDGFTSSAGTVYFVRDKKGMVTGLKISVTRARNVEFKKVK